MRTNWNALIGCKISYVPGKVAWAENAMFGVPDKAYVKKVLKCRTGRLLRHDRNFVWVQPTVADHRTMLRIRKKDVRLPN